MKNKNRLEREWEALCSYQAEPSACSVGRVEQNSKRNRSDAVVVCESIQMSIHFFGLFLAVRMFPLFTRLEQCCSITADIFVYLLYRSFKELHKNQLGKEVKAL